MKSLKIRKNKKYSLIKMIALLFIFSGICILIYNSFSHSQLEQNSNINISKFFHQDVNEKVELQVDNKDKLTEGHKILYIAVLEIPSIDLKRGLVEPSNYYNNVNYNIQIIDSSNMPDEKNGNFVLAGHSGNGNIAFFSDLDKLKINDKIYVYYKNNKYEYNLSLIYDVKKNGMIEISRDSNKTAITLVTCNEKEKDMQSIYIGYLISKDTY